MNCLTDCISSFVTNQIIKPVDAHVLSPFVKIGFVGGAGLSITVGNESVPELENTAIIESFSYHTTNGVHAEIEIYDQQGGAFSQFAERLGKCLENASQDYSMVAQWGWVSSTCGSDDRQVISSKEVRLLPLHLEVSLTEGKFKYKVTAVDLMQMVFSSREHGTIGREGGDGVKLKDALITLFGKDEPKIRVKFLRKNPDNTVADGEWDFDNAIKDAWHCDGQNKLATARNWIAPFKTDRNKGCFPSWSNTGEDANQPTIIFWEDIQPGANETIQHDAFSAGTFIVNGGACSSVIKFSPTVNWAAAFGIFSTGGTPGNSASGEQVVKQNNEPTEAGVQVGKNTGINTSVPVSQQAKNAYNDQQVNSKTSDAENAHMKANQLYIPGMNAIEAKLEIQGNPSDQFVDLVINKGLTASVVVVNPFHILGAGSSVCGDWLAYPGCNDVLSNRRWLIQGCAHSIRAGSYITTLDLILNAPAIQLNNNSPVGGEGSGGWKPNIQCG